MDKEGVKEEALHNLVKASQRALKLLRLLTVRQVIEDGHDAIEAAGLNPWCINEGRATGDEGISTWWLEDAIEEAKSAPLVVSDEGDIDDELYVIHAGEDRASFRLSDCWKAREALRGMKQEAN